MRGAERTRKEERDQRGNVGATGGSGDCRNRREKGGKRQYYRSQYLFYKSKNLYLTMQITME